MPAILAFQKFWTIGHRTITHTSRTLPSALTEHARYQARATAANKRPLSTGMKHNRLGSSHLVVSEVCLGTMTWGLQTSEKDAHAQIDYARSRGVNFLDTAEIYPVPSSSPDQVPGRTEEIVGSYLGKHKDIRSELIIATKAMGFSKSSETVANRFVPKLTEPYPDSRLTRESILQACDGSLRRLQTDYIDLYQLHWPDRYVPLFGTREYHVSRERDSVPIREILLAVKSLLDCGKIRAYGLSNETTFGVCEFVRVADDLGMPRPASIQNSFCLMDRRFESELAEACSPRNFNIGLLPWSILAGGLLTGKYNGKFAEDGSCLDDSLAECRLVKFEGYQKRFIDSPMIGATEAYMKVAKDNGMSVGTLAQAFCKSRWYIPSSIVGASKLYQLKENLEAFEVDLDENVLKAIDEVHFHNKDCAIS